MIQDTRYSLETLDKRQQCLLEALESNRVFTPELYLGLAHVYHLNLVQGTMRIGQMIEYPMQTVLDIDAEYVQLMKPKDKETRLDFLLGMRETSSLISLAEYVADVHKLKVLDISSVESKRWGSYDYLMQELEHNLELLDFLVNRCNESNWHDREQLAQRAIQVKKAFQQEAMQEFYPSIFTCAFLMGMLSFAAEISSRLISG
jgi:aminoglycoside phosphotransferase family enzyme